MRRLVVLAVVLAAALVVPASALADADLALTMTDSPDPLSEEGLVTYTLVVSNAGSGSATGVTVQLPSLPAGTFSFQTASPSQGVLVIGSGGNMSWSAGTITSGSTANLTIQWKGDHPGSGGTTATATSGVTDPNPANNTAGASTTVVGLSATDASFADQVVGTAGPAKQIVVTNGSAQSVTFANPAFTGDGADFIGANGCAGATVASHATCTLTERFFPSAVGARTAGLRFAPGGGSVDPLDVSFSGTGVEAPAVSGPPGPQGPVGPAGPPAFKLIVVPVNPKLRARAGRSVTFAYVATVDATATLDVLKGTKRVARVNGRASTGSNKLRWNGKAGRKAAAPGNYTLRLTAVNGVQTATATAKLKLTRR